MSRAPLVPGPAAPANRPWASAASSVTASSVPAPCWFWRAFAEEEEIGGGFWCGMVVELAPGSGPA